MTFDIFGGVSYNIDLRKPSGEKIVDLKLADGTPVTDDMKIKLGMNSYRFGQMTKKAVFGKVSKSQPFGNLKWQWVKRKARSKI